MIRVAILAFTVAIAWTPANAQTRASVTGEVGRFAIALLEKLQSRSIRENVEYCGLLGYDKSGKLMATKAVRGDRDGCEPVDAPESVEVIASYHTHGAWTILADTEVPSVEDLVSDFEEDIDGYIATPSGRVWQVRADDRRAYLLCGKKCIRSDPNYRDCKSLPVAKEYSLAKLRARAAGDTGLC